MRYRQKPIYIEAFQFNGTLEDKSGECCVPNWVIESLDKGTLYFGNMGREHPAWKLFVDTLDGNKPVNIGDYIVKGKDGELFLVRKEKFEKKYELGSITHD